jgi:hypothetical protein
MKAQGSINFPNLDVVLIEDWYGRAARTKDRGERFIFTWIVLNHYYSAWIDATAPQDTEREEVRAFADAVVAPMWPKISRLRSMQVRLPLPLERRTRGNRVHPVPPRVPQGQHAAGSLAPADYFEVCYQIRCDYVHANRALRGYQNEVRTLFVDPLHEIVNLLRGETRPPRR